MENWFHERKIDAYIKRRILREERRRAYVTSLTVLPLVLSGVCYSIETKLIEMGWRTQVHYLQQYENRELYTTFRALPQVHRAQELTPQSKRSMEITRAQSETVY